MLDVFYPSWSALIADLRAIRTYLRSGSSALPDTPEQYSLRNIKSHFEERTILRNGRWTTALFCTVA